MVTDPAVELGKRFSGLLLGTAVGDALGLPDENMSSERIRKLWASEWRMRFLFGRGMVSDDTEHTLMVAQALLTHPVDANSFQTALAWKFRWWFAGLPGGVGLATARACLKLWFGFPTTTCAVVSAGSGPAMRSAIIGAYFADDPNRRRNYVLASSRLTHRGWQAETAALAVAESIACSVHADGKPNVSDVIETLGSLSSEDEWQMKVSQIDAALQGRHSVTDFVSSLELTKGVTGYSLHVVPVALYAWLRHPDDFRTSMISALECGGDTDTVGAIVGALAGASGGTQGIPSEWLGSILEWPRSPAFIEQIAVRLAAQRFAEQPLGPVRYFWPGLIPRNILFLAIVLTHGFRRLAPPY